MRVEAAPRYDKKLLCASLGGPLPNREGKIRAQILPSGCVGSELQKMETATIGAECHENHKNVAQGELRTSYNVFSSSPLRALLEPMTRSSFEYAQEKETGSV